MDKLDNALETLQQSIDKHSQHVATTYQANAGVAAAALAAANEMLVGARKRNLEKYTARHRAYGYQWFLEVSNPDDFLEHEEFCQSAACAEGSVGFPGLNGWWSSGGHQTYWRAFKNKQDAAAFMLTFEAVNLLPEVDLNETDW